MTNTLFFGNYHYLYEKTGNHFVSGYMTGIIGSIVLNPFEVRKVNEQSVSNNNNKLGYMTGLKYTMLREGFANGIYFTVYNYCRDKGINSFLSGGMAGLNSWFWTYPFDTIRVRYQLNFHKKHTLIDLIKMGNLYKGIGIVLVRAFIVNGCGFMMYDFLHNL